MPDLNEQQLAIVYYVSDPDKGSLTVIARAGCGKTFVIVNGCVKAIAELDLGTCAVTAFNKAAALEFEARIANLPLTDSQRAKIATGTVHSFGNRIWRSVAPRAKLDTNKVRNICRNSPGEIYGTHESQICKLVSLGKQQAFNAKDRPVHTDREAWEYLINRFDIDCGNAESDIIDAAIETYAESLNSCHAVIDFDDMILAPVLFAKRPILFDWVIVDEAQDTNPARRLLALMMLRPSTGRLIAVGDDKQAIYGFTGADSDALQQLGTAVNAETLPLSITYRCPAAVVSEANRLVPDLIAHPSAPTGAVRRIAAKTAEAEADRRHWAIREGVTAADAAVCRNTRPLVSTAYSLILAGVGCRVEGRDIGEGLITLANRLRVATLDALLSRLQEHQEAEAAKLRKRDKESLLAALEDKCETLRLISEHLIGLGKTRVDDLREHVRSLFGDTKEGEVPNVFTLMTIHRSKGREFERVYFLDKIKTIPSKYAKQDWQLDQETNLEYVAITRAKRELIYVD